MTVGAFWVMALSIPVVPMMAGSRRSFFMSETLKWNGDEVWITTSNGGSDLMTSSKAPSVATSSTMTKSSFSFVIRGCALWISAAFSRDLTLVTTECPCSSRTLRTWVATKPLPPVFCFSVRHYVECMVESQTREKYSSHVCFSFFLFFQKDVDY